MALVTCSPRSEWDKGARRRDGLLFFQSSVLSLQSCGRGAIRWKEVHLCVKIMTVRKASTNAGFTNRKLTARRDSCCPAGAAGWRWIWSLLHNVNSSSLLPLSRVVVLWERVKAWLLRCASVENPPQNRNDLLSHWRGPLQISIAFQICKNQWKYVEWFNVF